jgi:hypothetical protein
MPPIIAGLKDGRITFQIAFRSLSPKDFAALKTLMPTEESCAFVIRNTYGNKAIDIIIEAPNRFFIEGRVMPTVLRCSDKVLEYSNTPTKIKA